MKDKGNSGENTVGSSINHRNSALSISSIPSSVTSSPQRIHTGDSYSINHGGHTTKDTNKTNTGLAMSNRSSGGGGGGGGSAVNSFHERLVGSIESAIGSSNIRRNSISAANYSRNTYTTNTGGGGDNVDHCRFPPAALENKAQGARANAIYGNTSTRTTYNSIRSGSSSVGHSPKKSVRMTTASLTNSSNQSLRQQPPPPPPPPSSSPLHTQHQHHQQQQQPHQLQSALYQQEEQQPNIKPATSNHSSISSLLSALSGAAGSSFASSGLSRTFTSGGGFPAASFSFFSSSLSSASSSLSNSCNAAASNSSTSTLKDSADTARSRASSISFSSSKKQTGEGSPSRNHKDAGKSSSNHIKLNSKVEKVLNSIPGLTLGQVQGAGVPPASSPSPTTSSSSTWGQVNTAAGCTPSAKPTTPTAQTASLSAAQTAATTTTMTGSAAVPNCNSINSSKNTTAAVGGPSVPHVQIQAAPSVESNGHEHCPSKPLAVTHEPNQQRKHSATFSSFKLSENAPKRPLKLRNHSVHTLELYDTLHFKSSATPQSGHCSDNVCLGSIVSFQNTKSTSVSCRPVEEVRSLAKDFFDQYYTSIKRFNSTSHVLRWKQIQAELQDTGTYNLTETELVYGAKLAWRNSVRCIGRIQWAKLQVFDARSVTTTTGMFEAVCKHIKYATNKGNIRSAITIFPQRTDGKHDFRIWNPQLITYAGYKQNDGSVIGDPLNVEFTEVCTKLGWKGKQTKFDILPLVLSADGHDPEYFEIPSELILEIPIRHPSFEWFAEMDMRWYALPAVSGMLFDCGGLEFTACPFNGWYMGTEIGCRDLGDVHRYNMLEEVAFRMGLDAKNPTTLWKDRALVELNLAVLYSYQKAGVTVVDHHTASESFMKHYENEMRVRGGCPADWVWIVPPMSGSICPVFHQEMALYHLKPNYEYQEPAWKTHVWKKGASQRDGTAAVSLNKSRKGARRKFHFKEIARAVKFTSKLFGKALSKRVKATILYATETGKSEMYARRLEEIFGHAFNAQVCKMDEYDIINIEHETLILVVTSTFGNGDPPENGESFAHSLYAIKMNQGLSLGADDLSMASSKSFIKMNSQTDSVAAERRFDRNDSLKGSQISDIMSDDNLGPLRNITFAVFALGSSAYPNFCAFGRYVDNLFGELGGERLTKLTCGDELAGQDQAFRTWASEIFLTACDSFCLDFDKNMVDLSAALKADTLSAESVRFLPIEEADDEVQALSKLHNRTVAMYNLIERVNLHESDELSRVTIKVVLRKRLSSKAGLSYQSGDHVGIMAENRVEIVNTILERLVNKPSTDDEPIQVQLLQEKHTPMGVQKQWIPHERLPKCSIRQILTRYLDVTTPPRPNLLLYLVSCTEDPEEQERLNSLAKDPDVYEHWKQFYWPNLVTVLEQFPNVKPEATVLCTMLPLLQPRFYSVSSSPLAYSDELHLTVAIVSYRTKGGEGPIHYGVCSNYLNDVKIGDFVPCFVRSATSFHMPADTSRPMIMIGPGTGIAPFRGFWQERRMKVKELSATRFGKMTLFFGCRTKEMILYRSELEALKKESILSDIFLALSREPSVKKTYVQDLLRREGEAVARQIMKENGHIYVCGDCTMAEDVYQTLKSIVQEIGNFSDSEVENYMLSLRDDNRYHEDIFGITHRTAEVHEKVRQTAMTRIESNYSLNNAIAGK